MEKLILVIAHELNNPLAITANYIHGCIKRLESGEFKTDTIIEALYKASSQFHRVSEIILRMKNFSCKGILKFEMVNLSDLLNETITLIKYENIGYPVEIKYLPHKNLISARIDKIHIQQVILNLARNAVEAMRDAKTIDPLLVIEINVIDNSTNEICVRDNGPGVMENIKHKLFNHTFTTKSYGLGLGLSISRSIVEAHGGRLYVEPSIMQGACFKFVFHNSPPNETL